MAFGLRQALPHSIPEVVFNMGPLSRVFERLLKCYIMIAKGGFLGER